jgi:hypothetical protein
VAAGRERVRFGQLDLAALSVNTIDTTSFSDFVRDEICLEFKF